MSNNEDESDASLEWKTIAERKANLRNFCFNQLSHVDLTDNRSNYHKKRGIFVPNAIEVETKEGNISEGLFDLLQTGWAIGVRKIQAYYEKGDKKMNNPLTGAFCASLNQGILTFYNTSLKGDSLNVNDITEAEQLIRQFQMFGAVALGELETQEQDLIVENLEQERDSYRKFAEKLENKCKKLEQELEVLREKLPTKNEK
jgi:hypothetical protein